MSLGSRHTETGLLVKAGCIIILERDAGGRWQLDCNRDAYQLLGKRVTVAGVRSGFDRLDVETIKPIQT